MTLSEFKAWFEGFTDCMDGAPSEKQWKKITAKVGEITGAPITREVYIQSYRDVRPYWNSWPNPIVTFASGIASSEGTVCMNGADGLIGPAGHKWDSHGAMFAAGKADAETEVN